MLGTSRGVSPTPSHSNDRPSTTKLRPSPALLSYLIIGPSSHFLRHLSLASASEQCFGRQALQVHISPSRSVHRIIWQAKRAERNRDETAQMKTAQHGRCCNGSSSSLRPFLHQTSIPASSLPTGVASYRIGRAGLLSGGSVEG